MNGRKRVLAALQGKPVDRRPICLALSLYGAKLTGCPLWEHYSSPTAYVRGQSAVLESFRPDFLLGPFSLPLEASSFGSEVRFFENQAPQLVRPAISSADEIGQLSFPNVDTHPKLTYFREVIRLLAAKHHDEVAIAAIASSPIDLPALLMGIESWLDALLFDEDGAKRVLEMIVAHCVRWIKALFCEGADIVILPAGFVSPAIIPHRIAAEITVPMLRSALSEIDGAVVLHSGGSPLLPVLDLLAGLPNVAGFVLNSQDSFAEARKKVGPEPVLIGNIDGPTLFQRKHEEIRADCIRILRDRRHDPRFILGTCAADIGFDTPAENIHVFREAADQYSSGGKHD